MASNPNNATSPPLAPTPESIIQELDISKFVAPGEETETVLVSSLPTLIANIPVETETPTSAPIPAELSTVQKPPSPVQNVSSSPVNAPSSPEKDSAKKTVALDQPTAQQSLVPPPTPTPTTPQFSTTSTTPQQTNTSASQAPPASTATRPPSPIPLSASTQPSIAQGQTLPSTTPVTPQSIPSVSSPASVSGGGVVSSTTTPSLTPTPTAGPPQTPSSVAPKQTPPTQTMQTPSSQAPLTPPQSHSPIPGQSTSLQNSPQRSLQTPPPRPPQPQATAPSQPPTISPKTPQQPYLPPRQSPPPAQSLPSIQAQLQSHPLSPGPQAPIQSIPAPVSSSQPPPSPQAPVQVPSPQPGTHSPLPQGPQTPLHQAHPPVQLTPIQSHPPQQPPSPLHSHLGGSHLPHPQLHAQQGPIQPTQASAGNAPPSPVLPPMQGPSSQAPLPSASQSIPPTLPAAPIQPIQTIQAIPIPNQQHQVPQQGGQQMQHQLHQLPHPMHSPMQHQMPQPMHPMQMQQTPPSLPSPQGQGQGRGVSPTPYILPQPARQIKFENALEFLDQVKLQFSKQPRVYNQFLDIMKDFKAQFIDTPGVIARVSELFKGHKHLILGFNTFLPPGYKIEIPDDDKPPLVIQPPPPPMQATPQPPTPAPPAGGRKQPEFDHASYVKKIKTRFQHQPTVYKSFLDILHAYHKEQHTIKDVYDQVATLFASHADLLEEFTQFLPDPVASANNAAMAGAIPPPISPTSAQVSQPQRGGVKGARASGRVPQKKPLPTGPPSPEKEKPSGRGAKRGPARRADDNMPSKKPSHDRDDYESRYGPSSPPATPVNIPKEEELAAKLAEGSFEELDFFNRVKGALGNPKLYHEFLKCLNLYSQEIISRVELVLLVKDLLSRYPDLFDWFKHFIGFDEASMELLEKKEAMALEDNRQPWSEIDYSTCKRYGPSYRALPANYGTPRCSGRSDLCWSTLNDIWVSVPTGSEDFTFKNQRKNQYEEVLFKCEDERYELDLVIELNTSAIRSLEPIKNKLAGLTEEEAAVYKMEPLDALHARSIERIYGDKGAEILEGIYANPSVAVPIVLQRLKQKDFEWHKSKQEWDKVWREITAKNYHKSLDHQSFFFKQAEKKTLSPKVLLAEIKQQYADKLREQQEESRENRRNKSVVKKEVTPWHLQYPQVFQDISDLILFAAEKLLSKADKEKIDTFLKHFLQVFFRVEDIYKQAPQTETPVPGTTPPSVTTPPPSTPPSTSEKDKPAEKEKDESEKEKAIPATPPTPNLAASGDVKMELEDKKDSAMEDVKETAEAKVEPSTTSASTPPISEASNESTPTSEAATNDKEGQAKEEKGKEAEKEKEATKEKAEEKVKRIRKIFFGNNSFYVFFRLYQIMYDRLAKGKELAEISRKSKWNTRSARVPKANGEVTEGEKEKEKEKEKEDNERDRYHAFNEKLYSLLAGALDLTHYEDDCRSLLGISSYVLFTMDKLVVQVTRHLQALLANEACAKLLSLFMYETVRPQGMLENVYHAGCAELLRDERIFLFEFEQIPNPGRFTIQLLDSNTQPLPKFMEFNFEPNKYSEYIASFQKDSSKIDPRKHHVFMVRNQKKIRDRPDPLNGVLTVNNLECRICLSTYRLFYVEDTEDFFYRPPTSRPPRESDKPKERKINFERLKINPPSADDAMKKM